MSRVFISGIGVISSIGINTEENYQSLLNERSGISANLSGIPGITDGIPLGKIKFSNDELFAIAEMRKRRGYSRTALLGIIAAHEALKSSGIEIDNKNAVGLISGTSVGGMDLTEQNLNDMFNNKNSSIYITSHDCGDSTEKIAASLGIEGYISTISTACSSAANSIMLGARLLKNKRIGRVIAGGTDALTSFTIKGFNSLMILSKNKCRPFDKERDGINLGEGAGYVVLESEESLYKRNGSALAEVTGYGNSCDAFHQTAMSTDGNGPFTSMNEALNIASLSIQDIQYINTHGTGTQNNDLSEFKAIERVFGSEIPNYGSTKQYTGHCLGASGGIEAVFSVLSLLNNVIFPNLNFETPFKECSKNPVLSLIKNIKVENVLSNSFGFGGNNTSLVFSKANNFAEN